MTRSDPTASSSPSISVREISLPQLESAPDTWLSEATPWVVRDAVAEWPLVQAAKRNRSSCLDYICRFYQGHKVSAFLGEPEINGRFFYNQDFSGFNFLQVQTRLDQVTAKLQEMADASVSPSLYVGATNIAHWLPGMELETQFVSPLPSPLASLWLGNESVVAPHFDYPANVACCVIGLRRFTLFPPDQVKNLYIGPWDITPAGQPISLVNTRDPDYAQHPLFREALANALVTELKPGDAIFIPSLWWHQVESTAKINGLVNFWWTNHPREYGRPMDAFNHALLSIKTLPEAERNAWSTLFDYYVFSQQSNDRQRWKNDAVDRTEDINLDVAKKLRGELINNLKQV
ncbi:MAG: cupin [Flammeovirgaceae bacterium]|nr:cupin [Flammeovirgaceae bacterium]